MRRGAAPQGRKELLKWLNGLCNSEYPAVESLRDGAAYCTIIEAAVNRIGKNFDNVDLPEAPQAREKAAAAVSALNQVDWSATAAVCETIDPSHDSMGVRKTCRANMSVLQEMLRSALPKEFSQEIDTERLATGKLQDHMRFLQWLYTFMNKALLQYSQTALKKKASHRVGEVEGVKLNRAQILLEHQRKGKSEPLRGRKSGGSTSLPPSSPRDVWQSTVSEASPAPPPLSKGTSGSTSNKGINNDVRLGRRSGPHSSSLPDSPRVAERAPPRRQRHEDPVADLAPRSSMHGFSASADAGTVDGFSYQRTPVVVPAQLKASLIRARAEVEELEALVMENHENHLLRLTRPCDEPVDEAAAAMSSAEELLQRGSGGSVVPPSLQDLGKLLEERDQLVQTYAAVDRIVRDYHSQGVPSHLLSDLCAILFP